jgi:hypothetical protein
MPTRGLDLGRRRAASQAVGLSMEQAGEELHACFDLAHGAFRTRAPSPRPNPSAKRVVDLPVRQERAALHPEHVALGHDVAEHDEDPERGASPTTRLLQSRGFRTAGTSSARRSTRAVRSCMVAAAPNPRWARSGHVRG